MIDINSLPKPKVLQQKSYENILDENINNFKTLLPEWQPLESDEFKMVLESLSYRELHLRTEFNNLAAAFFLSTATGTDLDNYAIPYYIERLKGAKPYAIYEFTLSETLNQNIVIPMNLILSDENSLYESRLLESVTILSGQKTGTGIVELQKEVYSSEIKTEVITTSLPFIIKASATSDFANGSSSESDADFKKRIHLSIADKSTAGSEETYKSYALKADERIEDVKVLNGGAGIVSVYYHSSKADSIMQTRIVDKLTAKDVRALTDNVVVQQAVIKDFRVVAELKILPNQETAIVYTNAVSSLKAGLKSLMTIGTKITLSEINDFLRVAGVKEVAIDFPRENVSIEENEIGVCSEQSITYTII